MGFMFIEGDSLLNSAFMTVITISTVGYSLLHELTDNGKIFAIFLIIISIGVYAYSISIITSYFVEGIVPEDHGFAIQPWNKVRFENAGIFIDDDSALAMGNYFFTDANTGLEAKVEFTFGYIKGKNGNLLINLHHSSFPYNPGH